MAAPTLTLCSILAETKRIINAHSRHFLALSVIFILPLAFAITVYPTFHSLLILSHPSNQTLQSQIFLTTPNDSSNNNNNVVVPILLSLFLFTFSLLTLGSVSYSVFHGFYGRPVKILACVKNVILSFFPLLSTTLIAQVVVFGVYVVFAGLFWVLVSGFRFFGFRCELSSVWFRVLCLFGGLCLLVLLVWVSVKWVLASVVVVVESSWGIGPLRRSSRLINGFESVALSIILFFGVLGCGLILCSYVFASRVGVVSDGWKSWAFVFQIVVTTAGLTLLLLYNSAACTVLYMYCKAVHGELAWEIAQEFSREYVSLPFDDGKVPHVVSIVYP